MSYLVLTDEEIGLLRYTCDFFITEESPLYYLEKQQKTPKNYDQSYHGLLKKKVLDPQSFRLKDHALNRLAPVSECDARIIHLTTNGTSTPHKQNFYLLEEIAVQHLHGEQGHAFGDDFDQEQLLAFLARKIQPRISTGDYLKFSMNSAEYAVFSLLLREYIKMERRRPDLKETEYKISVPLSLIDTLVGTAPEETETLRTNHLMKLLKLRSTKKEKQKQNKSQYSTDPIWEKSIRTLIQDGILLRQEQTLEVSKKYLDFARALINPVKTIFIRYDFGHQEWMMRETCFSHCDGRLFAIGPSHQQRLQIQELTGDALKKALKKAIGPLTQLAPALIHGSDFNDETEACERIPSQMNTSTFIDSESYIDSTISFTK